jgi:tetratricopeptide (TPR) repeat protein
MRRPRATALLRLLLVAGLTSGQPALAGPPSDGPSASATERKLPELPTPPSIELGRPEAAALAEVDALLQRITAPDATDREAAVRELLEAEPKHVPAVRFRISSVADAADKEAMKRLLLKTRHELREHKDDEDEKPSAGIDYLARLVQEPEPKSQAWRDLTSVLALLRMLESVGSVEAVRGLVDVYARFGEFLRITTQNALARLGERAVPALIEAQRHPAEKISKWAVRQLDMLGKGIPGEAVQTQDQAVLADVLRAYGRTRNPDAVRIVVSFVSSERAQVREAARQAVALMGEVASWQLRDTYENVVGKKPPRDWAWERTARELFAEFDRLRVARVGKLFEAGQAARAKGDYAAMRENFDQLLAYDPHFEQSSELAAGYVELAKSSEDKARADAIAALRRAERLDPSNKSVLGERLALEAEELEERGISDATLLERALEADPQNARAKAALQRFERGEPKRSESARQIAALAILGAAALAIAFLLLRRPAPVAAIEPATPEPEQPATPEPEQPATPEPPTSEPKPATSEPEPATSEPEPATSEPEPATSEPEPATSEPEPSTSDPATPDREPGSDPTSR